MAVALIAFCASLVSLPYAAAAEPSLSLSPSGTSSCVGTTHELTLTAEGTFDDPDIHVAGVHQDDDVSLRSHTGNVWDWTITGTRAGTDTFVGSGRYYRPDESSVDIRSNPATHTWLGTELSLSSSDATKYVGESATITARLTCLARGTVTMRVTSGPNAGESLTVTGSGASYMGRYTGNGGVGTDVIEATFTPRGELADVVSETTSQRWIEHTRGLSLNAPDAASCSGDSATFTAKTTEDGTARSGVPVHFTDTRPGIPTQTFDGTSSSNGTVTATFLRSTAGKDTIAATATFAGGTTRRSTVQHEWVDCVVTLAVAPSAGSSAIGSSFAKTATVNYRGHPAVNARVAFTATGTATSTSTQTKTADSSGRATASFDCVGAGTVSIRATAVVDGRTGMATATHACTKPPPNALVVRLAPAGTESLAGSPATFTALVTEGGAPLANVQVTFQARMPDQPAKSGSGTTSGSGTASFTVARGVQGTDTVTAHAVHGSRSGNAQVLHFWRVVPDVTVTLTPAGTTSEVDQPWTATLTVRLDRKPVKGAAVRFSASMLNQRTIRANAKTKSDGTSPFRFSRANPGLDTVVADVTLPSKQHGQASVSHLWRKGQVVVTPPPTLATDQPSSLPGAPVTASGANCAPLAPVTLQLGGTDVGRTTADARGRYSRQLRVPDVPIGRHIVTATCGGRSVTAPLDLVVQTSQTGTAAPAAATTAAILTFFVLLGAQLLRPSSAAPLQTPTT